MEQAKPHRETIRRVPFGRVTAAALVGHGFSASARCTASLNPLSVDGEARRPGGYEDHLSPGRPLLEDLPVRVIADDRLMA